MEFERHDDGVPSWVDLSSPDLSPEMPPNWGVSFAVANMEPGRLAVMADNVGAVFTPMALES